MRQNSYYFIRTRLLYKGIKDNNMLAPWKTIKVRITMSTPFGAINRVKVSEWKIKFPSQGFYASLELALFKWRKFVKEWEDNKWIHGDHKCLNYDPENPQIIEKISTK